MAEQIRIETTGTIAKEVDLVTLDQKIIPNTFVLEALESFPGYHGDLPGKTSPKYIYLVTSEFYTRERITRIAQTLKKFLDIDFDIAAGELLIYNDLLPCIRITNLKDYEGIRILQNCFLEEDIRFRKKRKIKTKGIIRIKKFFNLKEVKPGIYFDQDDPTMAYLEAPYELKWRHFEAVTLNLKRSWNITDFDAATGTFYRQGEIIDIVRVFRGKMEVPYLEKLKDLYDKEFEKARY